MPIVFTGVISFLITKIYNKIIRYEEAVMPIYEYRCKKCETVFQVLKPINKKEYPEKCPKCGEMFSDKLLSQFMSKVSSCNTF